MGGIAAEQDTWRIPRYGFPFFSHLRILAVMRDGASPYFQSSVWGTLISIFSALAQDGTCGSIIFI